MLVKQLMRKNWLTVLPDESVQEAAKKMRENHVGVALVLENEMFRGILTEQEITTAIAANTDEISRPVSSIATKPEKTAGADEDRCCYFSDVMSDFLAGK